MFKTLGTSLEAIFTTVTKSADLVGKSVDIAHNRVRVFSKADEMNYKEETVVSVLKARKKRAKFIESNKEEFDRLMREFDKD